MIWQQSRWEVKKGKWDWGELGLKETLCRYNCHTWAAHRVWNTSCKKMGLRSPVVSLLPGCSLSFSSPELPPFFCLSWRGSSSSGLHTRQTHLVLRLLLICMLRTPTSLFPTQLSWKCRFYISNPTQSPLLSSLETGTPLLGFVGHTLFVTTTLLWSCNVIAAARYNT